MSAPAAPDCWACQDQDLSRRSPVVFPASECDSLGISNYCATGPPDRQTIYVCTLPHGHEGDCHRHEVNSILAAAYHHRGHRLSGQRWQDWPEWRPEKWQVRARCDIRQASGRLKVKRGQAGIVDAPLVDFGLSDLRVRWGGKERRTWTPRRDVVLLGLLGCPPAVVLG